MSQAKVSFKAAEIGANINRCISDLDKLLAQSKNSELAAIGIKLHDSLKEYQAQEAIRVAFIGQYNAGKSTMISALTGRRDICIDSDIATYETSIYDWNGIQIIDTPGLFTDRKDHDDITYEAIDKADLLVFSLTYMLFDAVTAKNFKRLAYEKGYRWKMMIVVNKMSDEAGEEEQKITNYRQSLASAITPYKLDEFPLCFVDAKDYCEGIDKEDNFLTEISRFPTFIDALNDFVELRAALTKFDTPIRIVSRHLDDAKNVVMRDSGKDTAFFELLSQLSRLVQQNRERLRIRVKSITLRLSKEIVKEGIDLADLIGVEERFESFKLSIKQSEVNVQDHSDKAGDEIQNEVESISSSTKTAFTEVLEGKLFTDFEARLSLNKSVSAKTVAPDKDITKVHRQVDFFKNIAANAEIGITNFAVNQGATAASGFLNRSNVVGSDGHKLVRRVGKYFGFKFKAWQAVDITKNFTNFMKVVGPALSLVAVFAEFYAMEQEKKQQKNLLEARSELTSQFVSIAKDLEEQVNEQVREFESQFFDSIDQQISEARQSEEGEIKNSNQYFSKLVDIRNEFEAILSEISKAAKS